MSLWGNVDSGTVTGTLTATNASATVTGFTNTTTDSITTGDILFSCWRMIRPIS